MTYLSPPEILGSKGQHLAEHSPFLSTMTCKRQLRQFLRQQRCQIFDALRAEAEGRILSSMRQFPPFQQARRVAGYYPVGSEVDVLPILASARHLQKITYLPVINQDDSLYFAVFNEQSSFHRNRYNIPEPANGKTNLVSAGALDLIIVPLVGFDPRLHRLGSGAGYYDKTLAELHSASQPFRLGIAFECQRVPALPQDVWDVPLHAIITEQTVYYPRGDQG